MQKRLALCNFQSLLRYHAIGDSELEILVKGLGLPDRKGLPHSRIVMLLSPHVRKSIWERMPSTASEGWNLPLMVRGQI